VFRDGKGNVVGYNVKEAARLLKIPIVRVYDYLKELPPPYRHLFPGKRLPSEPMLVAGTKKQWQLGITSNNLECFRIEYSKSMYAIGLATNKKMATSTEICHEENIMHQDGRRIVHRVLCALVENGELNSKILPRRNSKGRFEGRRLTYAQ